MKKLLTAVAALLVLGCVLVWYLYPREKPELVPAQVLNDRVRMLLPTPVETAPSHSNAEEELAAGGCCTLLVQEWWQASGDFPETEKKLNGEGVVFETPRPELLIGSYPDVPEIAWAQLKHPDGSVVLIQINFDADTAKDAEFRRSILTSIRPGERALDLGARTEKLPWKQAGSCISVPVPAGFMSVHADVGKTDGNGAITESVPSLTLRCMRPMTTEEDRFSIGIYISPDAVPPPAMDVVAKRAGTLLGQNVEWTIYKVDETHRLIIGDLPADGAGGCLQVSCIGKDSDTADFFSIVEKMESHPME